MNKKNIQLIIPMSGIGKRFIDAGYKDPKPLINIDGFPIIKHVLDMFPGVHDILFICNKDHISNTNMKSVLNEICPHGKVLEIDSHKLGPVYAVSKIFEYINNDKEIIVSYCDFSSVWDFDLFIKTMRDENCDGGIACYIGFHPHMLGSDNYAFCKHENLILKDIKEKEPFTDNKMAEYASNGTYYFKNGFIVKKYFQKLLDEKISVKDEYYVSLVYKLLLNDNLKIKIFEIQKMLQWGTPYDLEIYNGWSKYFNNLLNNPLQHPLLDMHLVLPMAGDGDRFKKDNYDLPKPLLSIDNKAMILAAVDCLPKFSNISFICRKEHIEKYHVDQMLKNHYGIDKCTIYTIDHLTSGQACTCDIAIKNIDPEKPIMISSCDNGIYYDEKKYMNLIHDDNVDVIVFSFRNNQASKINPNMYSWLKVDENNNILEVSSKKFIGGNPLKQHAIIGTFYFKKAKYFSDGLQKNYNENIKTNNEFYVDDIINQNIKNNLIVKVFEVTDYICWGTPSDYKTYNYWKEYFQ